MKRLFTSESVTEGHPDKICDRISDAVVDAYLAADPQSRVACECIATTGMVLVMGEISSEATVDVASVARNVIRETGYDAPDKTFDGNSCAVLVALDRQSPDISMGVSRSYELKNGEEDEYNLNGAGDQGIMFGYACDETPELMPMPIVLAHRMAKRLTEARRSGEIPYLLPDGKTQVTVEYDGDKPVRIDTVVCSSQHRADVDIEVLRSDILEKVIMPSLPAELVDGSLKTFINPTGRFVIGGPAGDSGLTGRKIIVDTYGGYACHGGGCFSGKDPTKVDRSATYAARYAAKNVVAAGLAKKCQVELAYAIGVARPVSVLVDTFGTGAYPDDAISAAVEKVFDFRPSAIIEELGLRKQSYYPLAAYGHIGRTDLGVKWENADKVDALRQALK
ncbi:MAG: methionine adenosyltransferase [Clostridia bacterium]|nr:methionine adenosyltransferase [Clostridia bacterium]